MASPDLTVPSFSGRVIRARRVGSDALGEEERVFDVGIDDEAEALAATLRKVPDLADGWSIEAAERISEASVGIYELSYGEVRERL